MLIKAYYLVVAVVCFTFFFFRKAILSPLGFDLQNVWDGIGTTIIISLFLIALGFPYKNQILKPWFEKSKKRKYKTSKEKTENGPELSCDYFQSIDDLKLRLGVIVYYPETNDEYSGFLRDHTIKKEINILELNKSEGADWFLEADRSFKRPQRTIDHRPKKAKEKGLMFLITKTFSESERYLLNEKKLLINELQYLAVQTIDKATGKERLVEYCIKDFHEITSEEYSGFIDEILN